MKENDERRTLRVGTRGSTLALWQTRHVISQLKQADSSCNYEEVIVKTAGDKDQKTPLKELGGQGLFIKEIENALLEERIDLAVHSLKDMKVDSTEGLTVAAVLQREEWNDIFVSERFSSLDDMPPSSTLGTGSPRRKVQLNWAFPEPEVVPIRGNVGTRVNRVRSGEVDGIIIARAGVKRLGDDILNDLHVQTLGKDIMLPAPGQGAIAVQSRDDDSFLLSLLSKIHCESDARLVNTERAFLREIGGGCHTPVGALASEKGGKVLLEAAIASSEDSFLIRLSAEQEDGESCDHLARRLAEEAGMWLGDALE